MGDPEFNSYLAKEQGVLEVVGGGVSVGGVVAEGGRQREGLQQERRPGEAL